MSDPYVGEIRMFGGNFAPVGWAFCNGQSMPISENEVLFQLIGTTYGGDGQETFNLPNLMSRVPAHQGAGLVIGEMLGEEAVTLTVNQVPQHNHSFSVSSATASSRDPGNQVPAAVGYNWYRVDNAAPASVTMKNTAPAGGSQPHENRQPYLCISFIISLFGIFPSQT